MKRDDVLFESAVQAVQAAEPDSMQIAASARRVANRLGLDAHEAVPLQLEGSDAIENCEGVRRLFPSYRAGSLSKARTLLLEAHLHDCTACRRQLRGAPGGQVLDWSTPKAARAFAWRPQAFGWGLACAAALSACTVFVYKAYWEIPPGVRAEVRSIDGTAYRISGNGDRQLSPGDTLAEGEQVRTSGSSHAVLQLADGSTVEVNERTVLEVGARGKNETISLDNGAVIVQAAKRTSGHLYVKTPDCRVAVTGTVFSVNSGLKGSRVAVLDGTVHVVHAGIDTVMRAGEQVSTSDNLAPAPVEKQIAWSHNRDQYLPLLAQFATIEHRIEQIPFPQPRYTSDLINHVPSATQLYITIPNLGEFLSQANEIFDDQLKQSPALQQWWNQGHAQNTADLDALVNKIHQLSQYLGDEVVVVGLKQDESPSFAIVADIKQPGLEDFLKNAIPSAGSNISLTVLDQDTLGAASSTKRGGFALVLPRYAVFSNSIASLKLMNTQLNSGDSGFETGDFGKQVASAYSRGAGIILAADIQQMMGSQSAMMRTGHRGKAFNRDSQAMQATGMNGAQYLIAEHREVNGLPENQISVEFSGARQGVASWLAAPAPMGSLEFVTPNAAIAVTALSKDPAAIADDIIAMTSKNGGGLAEVEEKLQVNFRDDLAATLGGEFLVALDGPVLPTPSWKAVIEVRDAQHLEQTLERLTQAVRQQMQQNPSQGKQVHDIVIEPSDADGQRYYAVHDVTAGRTVAEYTFANGYMVVAANRALVMEALHTHASGDSLGRSASFMALLPKDANTNYSAVAYQNLSPVMGPLLSQFSGEQADALRQLAADARPTAICARGEETRIEAASNSRLFGFDFLTLGSLINIGNKHPRASVTE